jgi:ADP-ribose pyrophosphatase
MASSERVCANAAHKRKGVFVLREPGSWTVLSSRHLPDASPFLKVRVETIRLPDGRCIPDYYQLDMPSFACILAETADGRAIVYKQYRHGSRRTGLVFPGGHLEPDEAP